MAKRNANQASAYVRMSTDQQDLSIAVQEKAIQTYADAEGLTLVGIYRDEARSGRSLSQREGMQTLLRDVAQPGCPFSVVLVYDISRWGRFEDTDASAYYEYHCRMHGVDVVYVNEIFSSHQSPFTALIKSLKRVMAAEYSRELAVKVRASHDRAIALGFQMGAAPALAIQRLAVSKDREPLRLLNRFERKSLQSERIKWVPGPPDEVALVRRIFSLYADSHISVAGLSRLLRSEGVTNHDGELLSGRALYALLRSEAYIGNFVWGQGKKLSKQRALTTYSPGVVRADGVIEPILELALWKRAQHKLDSSSKLSRDRPRLVEDLRQALHENPWLTLRELPAYGCRCHTVYRKMFGTMRAAIEATGFDYYEVSVMRRIHRISRGHRVSSSILLDINRLLEVHGVASTPNLNSNTIRIGTATVKLRPVWRAHSRVAGDAWGFYYKYRLIEDRHVLVVRMIDDNSALDFILLSQDQCKQFPRWSDENIDGWCRLRTAADLVGALARLPGRPPDSATPRRS